MKDALYVYRETIWEVSMIICLAPVVRRVGKFAIFTNPMIQFIFRELFALKQLIFSSLKHAVPRIMACIVFVQRNPQNVLHYGNGKVANSAMHDYSSPLNFLRFLLV